MLAVSKSTLLELNSWSTANKPLSNNILKSGLIDFTMRLVSVLGIRKWTNADKN